VFVDPSTSTEAEHLEETVVSIGMPRYEVNMMEALLVDERNVRTRHAPTGRKLYRCLSMPGLYRNSEDVAVNDSRESIGQLG